MIILRQHNFSRRQDIEEFDKETDRIAEELNKESKKLPKKDQEFAAYLYNSGGNMANKAKYNDETAFRLPGRIIGSVAGYKIGKNVAEKRGKKHPGLIGVASGYAGGLVLAKAGQMIGQKHSDNVGRKKIRGNEEDVKAYMKMTPKERRRFEKNYDPSSYYFWDSLTKDGPTSKDIRNDNKEDKKSSKKIKKK